MGYFGLVVLILVLVVTDSRAEFRVSPHDLRVVINGSNSFLLYSTEKNRTQDSKVVFQPEHVDLARTEPDGFFIKNDEYNWTIKVIGLEPGHVLINVNISDAHPSDISEAFVRVTVERSEALYHISSIVGWVYFFAWSISFYPQIWSNYKRKSVVGLNFDYLSLNVVGFIMYSLFNCGLYWIPEIEQQYFSSHEKGLNPVQPNDIFFSLHAVVATLVTVFQCFIYETGNQKLSVTALIIHGIFVSFVTTSLIFALLRALQWLEFLYYCSYVKLVITLIKYIPQAFYNYKRKSTIGWSIGNIFLDFTGGVLSMLQMILNAHNYDDWKSIYGDPTKFGLGFFSVAFDVFFIVQHYVLYRNVNEKLVDFNGQI
ncbi:cystinosin homolog isoform X2 [Copidosoma floridanum]|uniref:cystinosin homolog isoform X2 n=1 Tax=Copidosoma floridanum TaxID=29053 RepID=UPI0006C959DE|nr:cystinosin homolog isoform X2 [Copidosoma floridanum]